MPPRYVYWTILVDNLPTAFRAAAREDLLPTFERLRSKHPDAVMRWFARGRLWDSPEGAAREGQAPRQHRDKNWRPGGNHRDPRERFEQERKAKNAARRQERFEHKTRNRRGDRAAGAPPDDRGGPPPRDRDDHPRDRGEGRPRQPGRDERGGADRPRRPRPEQQFGSERRPPAGRPRHQDAWRGTKGRDRGPQDRAVPRGAERPRHHREREGPVRPPRDDRFAARPRNERGGGDRVREPHDRDRRPRPPRDDRFASRPRDERRGDDRAHGRGDQRGGGRDDGRSRRGEQPRHDDRISGKRPARDGVAPRQRPSSLETRRGQAEPQPDIPPGPDRPPRPGQEPPPLPARSEEIVIPPAPPERGRSIAGPEGTRLIKRRGGGPR